jgi:hypothetical protein
MGPVMPVIRVDRDVYDALYERRLPTERNHNGAIRRALTARETTMTLYQATDSTGQVFLLTADEDEAARAATTRGGSWRPTTPEEGAAAIAAWHDTEVEPTVPLSDTEFVAEALGTLADLDEGEHTDWERLTALAESLRNGGATLVRATQDEQPEA